MMRVLQVVGTMDMGGAETLIMNLYRNIDREKIQFDFLCHNRIEAKYTDEIRQMGGKIYMVPGISHVGPIKYKSNLYKFFKSHPEYQTVHSHHDLLSGIILSQAKKAGVKNRYSHSHSTYKTEKLFQKLYKWVFKLFFVKSVTHAFACANEAGKALYIGKLKENFEFLPNGVDTKRFIFSDENRNQMRNELGLNNQLVIGHVGRFMQQKNHDFLIDIFAEILKINSNAQLVLIGEGELKSEIESKVKGLKIENNVCFLGSRFDVNKILSGFDVLVFPSFYEGLSVAMVEAQANGVPILTSTSVSSEVAFTDRVKQISLELSAEDWARYAVQMANDNEAVDRTVYAEKVKDAGFDIKATAKKLQNFYLNN